jgi:hypothetical protein
MSTNQKTPKIPLPEGWKHHVRAAVLRVISLAQYATIYTRSWAADSTNNGNLGRDCRDANSPSRLFKEFGRRPSFLTLRRLRLVFPRFDMTLWFALPDLNRPYTPTVAHEE